MELRSDIQLKGRIWHNVMQRYIGTIFETMWGVFDICTAIGILYDKQLGDSDELGENCEFDDEKANIPRTMFNRHHEKMELFFKASILTSKTINFTEKDRLFLAFSEDVPIEEMEGEDYEILKEGVSQEALIFDKIAYLRKFANYGATKLYEAISDIDIEMMDNLAQFLIDSYNGNTDELLVMKNIEILEDDEITPIL